MDGNLEVSNVLPWLAANGYVAGAAELLSREIGNVIVTENCEKVIIRENLGNDAQAKAGETWSKQMSHIGNLLAMDNTQVGDFIAMLQRNDLVNDLAQHLQVGIAFVHDKSGAARTSVNGTWIVREACRCIVIAYSPDDSTRDK